MSAIAQILALVVVGSVIVLLISAVGFFVGREVGSVVRMVLVSVFAAGGLSDDTATTVAETIVSITIAVVAGGVFVVVFPPTGILAEGGPQNLLSLVA